MKKQYYYQLSNHFFRLNENISFQRTTKASFTSMLPHKALIFYAKKQNRFNNWYNYQQAKEGVFGGANSWERTPLFLKLLRNSFYISKKEDFMVHGFSFTESEATSNNLSFHLNSGAETPRSKEKFKLENKKSKTVFFGLIWKSFPKKKWHRRIAAGLIKIQRGKVYRSKKKWKSFFFQKKKQKKSFFVSPVETSELYNSKEKLNYLVSALSNTDAYKTHLFFINRFSFSRYLFNYEFREKKKKYRSSSLKKTQRVLKPRSTRFIVKTDRHIAKRFRYTAVLLEDFARITFFALAMKKSKVLLQFCARALNHLPRKRKETNFRRFFIKLLKIFSSIRPEITAIRFRMNGRVNRWNRRKKIRGEKGILAFQSFDQHVDYSSVHAVNRKGALGLRLWIVYKPSYQKKYSEILTSYFAQKSPVLPSLFNK